MAAYEKSVSRQAAHGEEVDGCRPGPPLGRPVQAAEGWPTVGERLDRWAEARPDARFLTCGEASFTFRQVRARATAVASGFAALGIKKGDRVAILSPNRTEMLDLFFGLAKLGAIQVPLNVFLKGEFLRHQLTDSRAAAVVVDQEGLAAVEAVLDALPDLQLVVTLDQSSEPGRGDVMRVGYDEVVVAGDLHAELPAIASRDLMSILYTSGTTGLPKGCMLAHGYYNRVAEVMTAGLALTDADSIFTTMPMFHAGAQLLAVSPALEAGIPVTVDATYSPATFLPRCKQTGATVTVGVGPMATAMLAQPVQPADADHQVRTMVSAPLGVEDQERFRARFGIDPFVEIYGQTECVPVLIGSLHGVRNPASAGRPAHDLEIALLDEVGEPVPDGRVGEICVRSRRRFATFSGYWGRPEATFDQGVGSWHHTGDNGRRLEDGSYAFSDRKKDSLRRRGENVSSIELEAAIMTNPHIADVAVHAVPAPLGEDDIKACVVLQQGAAFEPEVLFDFFRNQLPYFAIPRYVEYFDSLPRNAVGRVLKHQLRDVGIHEGVIDFERHGLAVSREERRRVQLGDRDDPYRVSG